MDKIQALKVAARLVCYLVRGLLESSPKARREEKGRVRWKWGILTVSRILGGDSLLWNPLYNLSRCLLLSLLTIFVQK